MDHECSGHCHAKRLADVGDGVVDVEQWREWVRHVCRDTVCTVSKTGIKNSTHSVTFTVNSVTGSSSFGGTKSIVVTAP